jgi:hypothetical protein
LNLNNGRTVVVVDDTVPPLFRVVLVAVVSTGRTASHRE